MFCDEIHVMFCVDKTETSYLLVSCVFFPYLISFFRRGYCKFLQQKTRWQKASVCWKDIKNLNHMFHLSFLKQIDIYIFKLLLLPIKHFYRFSLKIYFWAFQNYLTVQQWSVDRRALGKTHRIWVLVRPSPLYGIQAPAQPVT